MRLQHSTWSEVETYLGRSTGIILPIGSTEQHGPNGPIGTDAICPETVAFGVGEQAGAMIGPTFAVGMAQHHMAFPGTITLRPATLVAVVRDAVMSLARHGFERIYFLNGHGGNIATVTSAFSEIYAERSLARRDDGTPIVRCKLANWFMGPRVRAYSKEHFGDSEGSHATPSEVSLAWHAVADTIRTDVAIEPKIAPRGPIRDAEDYRRRFPDGRIGSDPSLSSVEHGEKLRAASIEDVIEDYQAFVSED